ncbi:MAG: SMC-Scp complex subunit ScpB [Bacteroidota bacterium]
MTETNTIETKELAVPTTLKSLIEALIFAAQEPLTPKQMKAIYEGDRRESTRTIETETIREIVAELNEEYEKTGKAYRIVPIAEGYQFATLSQYAEWIGKLYKEQGRRKLSQSGIETLAIVAYKQPVTKGEVEAIRGVNCDYVLKTLLEKELVTVTGRAETVGRPLLYGTTREFLQHFGLNEITDLPRPREIEEILGESQFETERRMLEAQAGAEKVKDDEDFKSRLPHIPKRKPELDRPVEIVQKNRSTGLKTVSGEERKNLEEAGQEKIEFTQAAEVPQDSIDIPPAVEETVVESPANRDMADAGKARLFEAPSTPAVGEPEPETQVTKPVSVEKLEDTTTEEIIEFVEKSVQAPETVGRSPEESLAEPISDAPPASTDSEQSLAAREAVPAQPAAPDASNHPKSKWQTWKEKIQGFIRKMFA